MSAVVRGEDLGPSDPECRRGFVAAVEGSTPVPGYRMVTDEDGGLAVVTQPVLGVVNRAVVLGDVWRRLASGVSAGDGWDPFSDVRHVQFVGRWPHDADRQRRVFPCPVCGGITVHPADVAARYCVRCHRATGDPGDSTPGSPLARAVEAGVGVVGLPDVDRSGLVGGFRRGLLIVDDPPGDVWDQPAGWREAVGDWWSSLAPVELPVIPGGSS